eukprot:7378198-Prymnesium_polylepis.2
MTLPVAVPPVSLVPRPGPRRSSRWTASLASLRRAWPRRALRPAAVARWQTRRRSRRRPSCA